MPESYTRKPNTKCGICNKEIYRRPCQIKCNRVFCSSECYGISNRNEHPCIVCSKAIMAQFNKKTCSRSCANIHRTGIKYTGRRLNDKVRTLRALKLRVFDQRGKKCERCGYDKFEILEIHHKDRNRNNNNFSNLEIICPNCHTSEHLSLKQGGVA